MANGESDQETPEEEKGSWQDGDDAHETARQHERAYEDARYLPVILKRSDESVRHPDDTLELAIREGVVQATRGPLSLILSAVAAGATVAFTALAVGIMSGYAETLGHPVLQRLLVAIVYPLGFVLCLMSGTQLFTEHTAVAVYPVLDRRTSVRVLFRVWSLVLGGNLIGCVLGAVLLWGANGVVEASAGYASVAADFVGPEPWEILMSAVLAGWLMALGGWLVLATPPDFSQIVMIYVVTFLIGLGGLHHSIAGASELLVARFTGADLTAGRLAGAIGLAVLGNLAGGSLFVAVLNYGHIRQTQYEEGEGGQEKPRP